MDMWKKRWHTFSRISLVVKVISSLQLVIPILMSGWAASLAMTGDLPLAQVVVLAVLALAGSLLCVNQFRSLVGSPLIVRAQENLEFGLAYSGVELAVNPTNPSSTLQVVLSLSNCARVAVEYEVERLHVVIGNTIVTDKKFVNKGTVIPLTQRRVYRDGAFPENLVTPLIGGTHAGTLEADIAYGQAGRSRTRRYKLKLNLTVHLAIIPFGVADTIVYESDEPIF